MAEHSFPNLGRKLLESDLLIFFDFEATAFSHKAIALGAVGFVKEVGSLLPGREVFRFKKLIQTKDTIGNVVEKMTGIDKELLEKEGLPFSDVLKEFIDLGRKSAGKAYLSYSDMDLRILKNTVGKAGFEKDFYNHVRKSYVDLHAYLSRFLTDKRGQSLSLEHLATRLSLPFDGTAHDPLSDSLTLAAIYTHIVEDESRFIQDILQGWKDNRGLSEIEHALTSLLVEKGKLERPDLEKVLKEAL